MGKGTRIWSRFNFERISNSNGLVHHLGNLNTATYTKTGVSLDFSQRADHGDADSLQNWKENECKILVAEDNKINQKVVLNMLKRLGYRSVQVADNGKLALDLHQSTAFDVILMDCLMPVMNGTATTIEIRKLEQSIGNEPLSLSIHL